MSSRGGHELSLDSVRETTETLKGLAIRTPIVDGHWLSKTVGGDVALKAECLQRTGSFKVRGVASRLAQDEPQRRGVITASAGNHGLALAYVAVCIPFRAAW